MSTELERAREAYDQRQWNDAYNGLVAADEASPLAGEDLRLLAMAAYFLGRDDDCIGALERAHHAHLAAAEDLLAVRCAFWAGMRLAARGDLGPAMGWFKRAQRILEAYGECVEHGYLLLPTVMQHRMMRSFEEAHDAAIQAAELGRRFRDADLVAFAIHEQGHALAGTVTVDANTAPWTPPRLSRMRRRWPLSPPRSSASSPPG